jgi:hypothetical protein
MRLQDSDRPRFVRCCQFAPFPSSLVARNYGTESPQRLKGPVWIALSLLIRWVRASYDIHAVPDPISINLHLRRFRTNWLGG